MVNVVRRKKYIQTNVDESHNKFWYITEYDDATVVREWGAVGTRGQKDSPKKSFPSQDAASKFFDKECKGKEKGKKDKKTGLRKVYTELQVLDDDGQGAVAQGTVANDSLSDVAHRDISGGDPIVGELVAMLVRQNQHNILTNTTMKYSAATGLFSTACGIVTQASINEARSLLNQLVPYVSSQQFEDTQYAPLLNQYLMLIPQKVKRQRGKLVASLIFPDAEALRKQDEILTSLQASLDTLQTRTNGGSDAEVAKVFDVRVALIEDEEEIERITRKYMETRTSMHTCAHLRVSRVFSMRIGSMVERFEREGVPRGNIFEYWHGSRTSNLLSILHKGLMVPPKSSDHVTGRLVGDGLYFSDISTKALGYSYGFWSGGNQKDNNPFMFLADVAMGKVFEPTSLANDGPFPVRGYDSTLARAGTTIRGHRTLKNNEMIVYTVGQVNLKRMVEFTS